MPKIQKLRRFKMATQSDPYSLPSATGAGTGAGAEAEANNEQIENKKTIILSRGQKRRQEKREKVLTKLGVVPLKGMKTGLVPSKPQKQKPFQSLLSELEATLPKTKEVVRPAAVSLKSNKIKKSVAIRESQRMKLVEQHPNFIADPLTAMKAHIEQMIALKIQTKSRNK
jgi:hypothetical protein